MKRRDFIAALAAAPAVPMTTEGQGTGSRPPASPQPLALTLLGTGDLPGIREQIVHEIQQVFEGKVVWGEDLMRLGITGARVSSIETRQG